MDKYKTILKLKEIFKLGYRPERRLETYRCKTPSGFLTGQITNCLEHACFNLTNKQIIDNNFSIYDKSAFQSFIDVNKSLSEITQDIFNFVEDAGLKVSDNKKIINKQKEWRVALYYRTDYEVEDYHFLLQEKSGIWTSKMGSSLNIQKYLTLPKVVYRNYDLYGVYTIKNPYIKEKQTEISI